MQQVKVCPAAFSPVWKGAVSSHPSRAELLDATRPLAVAVCTQHSARPTHRRVGGSSLQCSRLTAFDYNRGLKQQNF